MAGMLTVGLYATITQLSSDPIQGTAETFVLEGTGNQLKDRYGDAVMPSSIFLGMNFA